MTVQDACIILGIEENSLTEDVLKHAFYNAANLSHPDNNPQNAYADTKFAMIQEAYLVLKGHVIELGGNIASEYNCDDNTKSDPWVAYNDADRKFAKMKQDEAKKKVKAAFSKHQESVNKEKTVAYQKMDTNEYVTVATATKKSFIDILKKQYMIFVENDIIFDSMLAACVALMILLEVVGINFIFVAWMTSILLSRHVAKIAWKTSKNLVFSGVMMLVSIELIVELMKLFLI